MHKHHGKNIYTIHQACNWNQPITTPHFLGKIKIIFPWNKQEENQINKQRLYFRERERER